MIKYEMCDLVFTASKSFLGTAIRWATRERGEEATVANHVGLITSPGLTGTALITEALWHVQTRSLYDRYHKNGTVAAFRPKNLTTKQAFTIVGFMVDAVGQKYGWWKLLFHLGYKVTGKEWFRNFLFIDKRPICSYLVARAFEEAGLYFGQVPGSCTPDDMYDFCISHPEHYELVHLMETI